ncbi:unnamed protein product [Leptidea sinapis]|uniref:Uncharacterized protein n=1 Tax=Leptidea sinapis TaxID=189913 RepID=A0A5E4QZE8_9NEOP|nr:unnamed protein product [Leptidea sinapis]
MTACQFVFDITCVLCILFVLIKVIALTNFTVPPFQFLYYRLSWNKNSFSIDLARGKNLSLWRLQWRFHYFARSCRLRNVIQRHLVADPTTTLEHD